MKSKIDARIKRSIKTRQKIRELTIPRLTVHKTPKHIYVQLFSADGTKTIASASTLDKETRGSLADKSGVAAAVEVGKAVAKRALSAGCSKVAFDRSGFKYHGRIKALADAAREAGLQF